MTIVLIDDDATTIAIHKRFAKKFSGEEPMAFTDPDKGLVYLREHKADLIVLDYSMPKLSGIEIIHALREGSANQTTPIVMVTSAAFESVKGKVILAGAQDFVTKPVSAEEFKARVLSHAGSEAKALEPSH